MLKKYKLGFEIWGLLLFLIMMIPNFIWFVIPAPNEILRDNTVTEKMDTIASICQVLMVVSLCIFTNRESKKLCVTPFMIIVAGCCLLYFISWIVYYVGIANVIIILGLTILPCAAFLFFAIDRKNKIAMIPILAFTICHLIYGIVNFII